MANTGGGLSGLGVEDDGSVTGLPPEHQSLTGLAILIASRTGPAISTEIIAIKVQEVQGAKLADLNPLERERLRQMIQRHDGDKSLPRLSDGKLDSASELIRLYKGATAPPVIGLLTLGKELALRNQLPTHKVAFLIPSPALLLLSS